MKTIIVTGGAGFIGSNLVYHLLSKPQGHRIVVFDKLTYAGNLETLRPAGKDPRFIFVRGDIADRKQVRDLFHRFHPEQIYNLAAESHVDRSIDGAAEFVKTNLAGTFELLEAARFFLRDRPLPLRKKFRFLHISTDEVYGSLGKQGAFSEKTPYAPNSPYSATKAGADHLVRAYHETYGLPVLSTNCSNNYGPYQFPEKLIPLIILNAMEGKPLPVYGDGLNVRDWLYVEDHCSALARVMAKGKTGEKYNVGGNSEKTNLQVIAAICRQLSQALPPARNPKLREKGAGRYEDLVTFVKDRPGHDRRYAIDASKIRRELGWQPAYSFEKGMGRTVRWYIENGAWCRKVQQGNYGRQRLGLAARPAKGKK